MLWNLPQDSLVEKLGVAKKCPNIEVQIMDRFMQNNDQFLFRNVYRCFCFTNGVGVVFGNGSIEKNIFLLM